MPRFALWGLWVLFATSACSSDENDDPATTWQCFEGSTECWCVELTPGNDADSSDPEVDQCSYTNCVGYHEGDSRHCRCAPGAVRMDPFWEDPMPVAACPLE